MCVGNYSIKSLTYSELSFDEKKNLGCMGGGNCGGFPLTKTACATAGSSYRLYLSEWTIHLCNGEVLIKHNNIYLKFVHNLHY